MNSINSLTFLNSDSLASEHLTEDAAGAPDIHRSGVCGLQQNFRRSVPQSHHLRDTDTESDMLQPTGQSNNPSITDIFIFLTSLAEIRYFFKDILHKFRQNTFKQREVCYTMIKRSTVNITC